MYIATQGPIGNSSPYKKSTITDFWRLVVTSQSRIIVMVANQIENGREKVGKYWPDKNKILDIKHGNKKILSIENIKEDFKQSYVKRTLIITAYFVDQIDMANYMHYNQNLQQNDIATNNASNTYSWKIYQYQYLEWPDHGVPDSPHNLVEFLTDIHREHEQLHLNVNQQTDDYPDGSRGKNGSLIVHCSAGVGRTGVVIAIDMIMDKIRWFGLYTEINIYKTLQKIRQYRKNMVQTKQQYKFIYDAVACYWDR